MLRFMQRKPQPKWDDPAESQRFLDTAKAVEASDDPREFEAAFKRIAPTKSKPKPSH